MTTTTYPTKPGYQARDTSKAAATHITAECVTLRQRSFALIGNISEPERWRTPDEIAELLHESVLSIRPRMTELVRFGLIEDSDQRRSNASGRMAIVYRRSGQ
jgi:predicted transcriptional regulator